MNSNGAVKAATYWWWKFISFGAVINVLNYHGRTVKG